MDIVQIAAIGMIGAVMALTLKKINPETALFVSVATGVLILMGILRQLSFALNVMQDLAQSVSINENYIKIIIKIIGISYIAQFGMELCKDAGETAIASKIELAGKVLIITVSIPVITGLIDTIATVLP